MSQLGQLAAVSTSMEIRAVIQQAMPLAAVLFFLQHLCCIAQLLPHVASDVNHSGIREHLADCS